MVNALEERTAVIEAKMFDRYDVTLRFEGPVYGTRPFNQRAVSEAVVGVIDRELTRLGFTETEEMEARTCVFPRTIAGEPAIGGYQIRAALRDATQRLYAGCKANGYVDKNGAKKMGKKEKLNPWFGLQTEIREGLDIRPGFIPLEGGVIELTSRFLQGATGKGAYKFHECCEGANITFTLHVPSEIRLDEEKLLTLLVFAGTNTGIGADRNIFGAGRFRVTAFRKL